MGKINTSIDSNNLSNFSFYIDLEQSINYTFPFEISTSVPGPIYARIKNTGAGTITISGRQIIFFMGQPGVGAEVSLTTISPNETKYFSVSSRYLPSTYVYWDTYTDIKIGGKTSIKKQNFTNFIVSEGSILPPGIDPNGVYLLQNSLINGKSWYIRSDQGISIRIVSSISSIWAMQYLLNNWFPLTSSTNPAANPWEATWPSNIQVSLGSGGKLLARQF